MVLIRSQYRYSYWSSRRSGNSKICMNFCSRTVSENKSRRPGRRRVFNPKTEVEMGSARPSRAVFRALAEEKGGSTALYAHWSGQLVNLHPGAIEPNCRVRCALIKDFDFGPGKLIRPQWVPIEEVC